MRFLGVQRKFLAKMRFKRREKSICLSPQESWAPLAGEAFLHVWASLDFSCLFCRSVRALELPCTDNMSIPPLTFRRRGYKRGPATRVTYSADTQTSIYLPAVWKHLNARELIHMDRMKLHDMAILPEKAAKVCENAFLYTICLEKLLTRKN